MRHVICASVLCANRNTKPETDGDLPGLPHQLLDARFTNTVIPGILMMDDDRGSGLLRDQLVRGGEGYTKFRLHGRQKLKYLLMIFQFRNGRVAPGITLALVLGNAQLAANVLV